MSSRPFTLPQGLTIKMLKAGDWGTYPNQTQSVAVHYDAFLPNGSKWDSSRDRGRPLRFRLGTGQVIPGLDEGISQLSLGSRARMTIPPELACEHQDTPSAPPLSPRPQNNSRSLWSCHSDGSRGFPGLVPPDTAIDFDIELLEID
mmetsp:Transcript_52603/g.136222  ORF Transcript_52603/g.136222 Transcript_52603/m.136222 type:complete len:146 (-) Transcript_52603:235-672(-)